MEVNRIDEKEQALLELDFEDLYKETPLTKDTQCGYWIFRQKIFQPFANKKAFIIIHGIVGACFAATNVYFNSTISTLEKRFRIPSRNTGIIALGYECSSMLMIPFMSYVFSRKHRPRWIAVGALTTAMYGLALAFLHIIYGPGDNAYALTHEFGDFGNENDTTDLIWLENQKTLCQVNLTSNHCIEAPQGSFFPQVYIFLAQFATGIFAPFYDNLGTPYMDDNILSTKTPALISFVSFIRMLGPTGGSLIASWSLKSYIIPNATPTITSKDPRWLGAWWMGWLVIGFVLLLFAFLLSLFPRELPRAALRRRIKIVKQKMCDTPVLIEKRKDSFLVCLKRVLANKVFMVNTIASVFYFFGFQPYWMFMSKYIETQYRQSTSQASLIHGTINFIFSAAGILGAGLTISKIKPSARALAAWNVFVSSVSVSIMLVYISLGCSDNDRATIIVQPQNESLTLCMSTCNCEYVKYTPICGVDGNTYISPCHAGCSDQLMSNGSKIYNNCACIEGNDVLDGYDFQAKYGPCHVDCQQSLIMFIIATCVLMLAQSSGRTSNFLVGIRCVLPEDKSFSMAIALTIFSVFAFAPGPIVFGQIFDATCVVWGKTCTDKGNCWLYNSESMRFWINSIAAGIYSCGVLMDIGTWYFVKNLKIFSDDEKDTNVLNLMF